MRDLENPCGEGGSDAGAGDASTAVAALLAAARPVRRAALLPRVGGVAWHRANADVFRAKAARWERLAALLTQRVELLDAAARRSPTEGGESAALLDPVVALAEGPLARAEAAEAGIRAALYKALTEQHTAIALALDAGAAGGSQGGGA